MSQATCILPLTLFTKRLENSWMVRSAYTPISATTTPGKPFAEPQRRQHTHVVVEYPSARGLRAPPTPPSIPRAALNTQTTSHATFAQQTKHNMYSNACLVVHWICGRMASYERMRQLSCASLTHMRWRASRVRVEPAHNITLTSQYIIFPHTPHQCSLPARSIAKHHTDQPCVPLPTHRKHPSCSLRVPLFVCPCSRAPVRVPLFVCQADCCPPTRCFESHSSA